MASSGTAVVTLPTDTQSLITREFAAPRHLVYKAWTTPELIKQWWSAKRGEVTVAEVDLRVGGKWRYVMVADGGFEVAFHGEYRELIKNERIVSTEVFEGMPEAEAVDTMTFTEVDGRTTNTILVQHTSREHRDAPHQLRRGRGTAGRVGSAGTGGDFAALAQSHSSSVQWSRPRSGDH